MSVCSFRASTGVCSNRSVHAIKRKCTQRRQLNIITALWTERPWALAYETLYVRYAMRRVPVCMFLKHIQQSISL